MRGSLLGATRRQQILERVNTGGQVELSILVSELGCSPETLRRDLRALEQTGLLKRVYGGAIGISPAELPPLENRKDDERHGKARIAGLAKDLVEPKSLVFVGGGSTTLAVCAALAGSPKSTFVTTAIDVAATLVSEGRHEVFLSGGAFDGPTRSVVGPETTEFIKCRVFDLAIIGISAIELKYGFMGPTSAHIALTRVVRDQARQVMVVCDVTKFGRPGRYKLLDFSQVDVVVTNQRPAPEFAERLDLAGTRVVVPAAVDGPGADDDEG
ncbi:DeoR family transcriptional regulator [Sinorhizobium medicae]|nr:DeoR family transcriptional regulator [Sinorhizobium medicae]